MRLGSGQVARRRTREWELSEEVEDGVQVAALVAADLRREASARRMAANRPNRPQRTLRAVETTRYAPTLDTERQRDIAQLLDGARRGDLDAARELRERYRAWVDVP